MILQRSNTSIPLHEREFVEFLEHDFNSSGTVQATAQHDTTSAKSRHTTSSQRMGASRMADSNSKPTLTHPALPSPFNNTSPPPTLIAQGAEAHLYRTTFLTSAIHAALKIRPSKPYRHPTLDARLTKQRVLAEARVLAKLANLPGGEVRVPGVLAVDWDLSRGKKRSGGPAGAWLLMEWVEGRCVKDLLREWDAVQKRGKGRGDPNGGAGEREEDVRRLLRRVGRAVGAMHSKGGVVHGDLTSSNIMVRPLAERNSNGGEDGVQEAGEQMEEAVNLEGEIVLIDFGLATQSIQDEDRAVDLYVLERAFGSTHPRQEAWFKEEVLDSQDGYKGSFKGANVVLKRLEEVRMRGRKRSMVG